MRRLSPALLSVMAAVSFASRARADTPPPSWPFPTLTAEQQAQLARTGVAVQKAILVELDRVARGGAPRPSWPPPPPPSLPPPPPSPPPQAEPSEAWLPTLAPLRVPGFGDAYVAIPRAPGARPVLVAAHGAPGRPDHQCDYWRRIIGHGGFVLCPQGTPFKRHDLDDSYYTHGKELPAEIDARLAALSAQYGARVHQGPMIYAGYSQGAWLGPSVASRQPWRFTRVVLIEGGGAWDEGRFAKGGGERVLFACGQEGCARNAREVGARFERQGVRTRLAHSPGAGHTPHGAVLESVKASWPWVIEGDPRWSTPR